MERERRSYTLDRLAVVRSDDKPKLVGHAAVFEIEAEIYGMFREKVAKGAFRRAIAEDDVRALWNHNPDVVLGRNRAGTLKLSEDDVGLAVEIVPPDTQAARDLLVSMERGDVTQMSFGFMIKRQQWEEETEGKALPLRTILEVELLDVSPVTFPAYPQTDIAVRDVAVRSLEQWRKEHAPPPAGARQSIGLMRRRLELAKRT